MKERQTAQIFTSNICPPVKNLGVTQQLFSICFRILAEVKGYLPATDSEQVTAALVPSQLDYSYSSYVGADQSPPARFQRPVSSRARDLDHIWSDLTPLAPSSTEDYF